MVAEKLYEQMKSDLEKLGSRRQRLKAADAIAKRQKKKYEGHLLDLNDCLDDRATGQRSRASAEAFQLEKTRKNVESVMRVKLYVVSAIIRRDSNDEAIDYRQARDVVRDIISILGLAILELSGHVGRLEKVLGDMKALEKRANEIMLRSASKYDVAENAATIVSLNREVGQLLQKITIGEDPYIISSGKNNYL